MEPRIVTITLNPAVDIACSAQAVMPTHKVRTFDDRYDPGGGGINVAHVIHILGGDVLALLMTGGVTGRFVEELLDDLGLRWQAVPIHGRTRISLNVHDLQSGLEYRFVPEGPEINRDEGNALLQLMRGIEADWIVASGSLAPGLPVDTYARLAGIAAERGQYFALDTSGDALRSATKASHAGKPLLSLLKLSLRELEFLVGHDLATYEAQEIAATALIREGAAECLALSLGPQGALLVNAEGILRLPALEVKERSAVGAGDSFLAGLVLGLARGLSKRQALGLAISAGAAAVSGDGTARVKRDIAEAFYREFCARP